MKKLFLALALIAYIGTTSATSLFTAEAVCICVNDDHGKDKKKKKNATEAKSCEGKEAAEKKEACTKMKAEGKSCCAKKAAATSEAEQTVKPQTTEKQAEVK